MGSARQWLISAKEWCQAPECSPMSIFPVRFRRRLGHFLDSLVQSYGFRTEAAKETRDAALTWGG